MMGVRAFVRGSIIVANLPNPQNREVFPSQIFVVLQYCLSASDMGNLSYLPPVGYIEVG